MSDSVDRVFIHALQTVRKLPRTGSSRPPPHDRLCLYGLYKQSMEGNVESIMPRPLPISSPPMEEPPLSPSNSPPTTSQSVKGEIEKWDAGHACAGMSRTEAKRKYIDYLIETMKKYASGTQGGRELVGELEFVWEQIRNNNSAGSGSSEDSGRGARPTGSSSIMHSFNAGRNARAPDAGPTTRPMRVLSPVGRGDGGDISGIEEDEKEGEDGLEGANDDGEENFQESRERAYPSSLDRRKRMPRSKSDPPDQRKWKIRIETVLSRLTVEVAALREQMSDSRVFLQSRPRGGILPWMWKWVKWIAWTAVRQVLFNLLLLGCAILWGRWRDEKRIEEMAVRVWKELRLRERVRRFTRDAGKGLKGLRVLRSL